MSVFATSLKLLLSVAYSVYGVVFLYLFVRASVFVPANIGDGTTLQENLPALTLLVILAILLTASFLVAYLVAVERKKYQAMLGMVLVMFHIPIGTALGIIGVSYLYFLSPGSEHAN